MFYFLNNKKEWTELPINSIKSKYVYPHSFTFGIDEALDVGQINLLVPSTFDIDVDVAIKQQVDDFTYYWVVKDSKSTNLQYSLEDESKKLLSLSLIEPIDLLRGFKLPPCAFAEGSYTFVEVIQRLCNYAHFNAEIKAPNVIYKNPKLTYTSSTLYLALFEIARSIDYIPYLDFNETSKKWIVCFDRLDGLNGKKYDYNVFSNPTNLLNSIGEGLAKYVYSEVSNIVLNYAYKEPFGNSKLKPEALDGTDTITNNNMGLELTNSINQINRITIYGFSRKADSEGRYSDVIDYDYPWILENNQLLYYITGKEGEFPTSRKIVFIKDDDYQLLTPEEKKKAIIYIRFKDNFIYLSDLLKIANSAQLEEVWIAQPIGDVPNSLNAKGFFLNERTIVTGVPVGDADMTSTLGFGKGEYVVNYTATITDSIPLLFSNNSEFEDTVYFNQTSQQVDADRIGRVLKTYIDNMSNPSTMKSGVFKNWNEIPFEGSIIEKSQNEWYLVDSVTIEDTGYCYNVDAQLVGEHAQRRETIEASTDLQLATIPNNDLVTKLVNDFYTVYISIEDEIILPEESTGFYSFFLNRFFSREISNFYFHNHFGFKNGKGTYIGQPPFVFKVGNSIIFHEKAKTNLIWDEYVDENNNMKVEYYVDENAEYSNSRIFLGHNDSDASDTIFDTDNIALYDKDPYEIFNYTFQVAFNGYKNTIVREEFVNEFLSDFPLKKENKYLIKLYSKNIGAYDELPTEDVVIENVTLSSYHEMDRTINVTFQTLNNLNYKSLVLLKNEVPLLIKNYFDFKNSIQRFLIYFDDRLGTNIKNGVYANKKDL